MSLDWCFVYYKKKAQALGGGEYLRQGPTLMVGVGENPYRDQ